MLKIKSYILNFFLLILEILLNFILDNINKGSKIFQIFLKKDLKLDCK